MNLELLTSREICSLLKINPSTLWRWVKAGTFPAPLAIGPNCRRWLHSKVAEWKAENYDDDEACEAKPTALYRHFDGEGRLLYVGISLSAIIRLATHRASPWFDEIASVEIERYQTRKDALTAELAAIHNEKPLHNVVGVVRDNIGTTTAARLGAIRRDRMQQECNEKVQAVEVVE